jgi:uncharacterized membrane protein
MTLDKLFLALHVFGAFVWVSGLLALLGFIDAVAAEPAPEPRARLVARLRKAALVPDLGGTIAILFGLHWLFRFKLYQAPYMHPKLALVVVLLALHSVLKVRARKVREDQAGPLPRALTPALWLVVLGILVSVITKVPS